ncbi:MAG TPA: hypothetical protein VLG14_04880 [Sphingomonas sp.]|jgi:hypothetical protein|nr:hypothetical protein [Sphingomonas sp.]
MLVRLFVMLALILSTLPAHAAAAPACHDEPAPMAGHIMAMDEAVPEPQPVQPMKMGNMLCVGCIAPTTLKVVRVAPPRLLVATHGLPPLATGSPEAALTPEPPPPRA